MPIIRATMRCECSVLFPVEVSESLPYFFKHVTDIGDRVVHHVTDFIDRIGIDHLEANDLLVANWQAFQYLVQ